MINNKCKLFYSDCDYYSKIVNYSQYTSFEEIPLLTKNIVRKYNDWFLKKNTINIIERETSGSTGTILKVYWSLNDHILSFKQVWNIRRLYEVNPMDYYITDHVWMSYGERLICPNIFIEKNHISFSKIHTSDEVFMTYISAINKYNPTWVQASPSFIQFFGEFCKRKNITLKSIKLIELIGEYLSIEEHNKINFLFPNVFVKNVYGLTECNICAYEKENNILESFGANHIEILKSRNESCQPGEVGKIVVTNYANKAMPLVKYDTGDKAKLVDRQDDTLRFEILSSRKTDYYKYDQIIIPKSFFYYLIKKINTVFPNKPIEQFLFSVVADGKIDVFLKCETGKKFTSKECIEISDAFQIEVCETYKLKIQFSICIVDRIPYLNKKNTYFLNE